MREMRRKDRQVTDPEKIREIIAACDCCRLGLCDHGRAYVVPLDFGFTEQEGRYTFYFHSAREGRKIDLIRQAGWASFEMDAGHEAVPDETAGAGRAWPPPWPTSPERRGPGTFPRPCWRGPRSSAWRRRS